MENIIFFITFIAGFYGGYYDSCGEWKKNTRRKWNVAVKCGNLPMAKKKPQTFPVDCIVVSIIICKQTIPKIFTSLIGFGIFTIAMSRTMGNCLRWALWMAKSISHSICSFKRKLLKQFQNGNISVCDSVFSILFYFIYNLFFLWWHF